MRRVAALAFALLLLATVTANAKPRDHRQLGIVLLAGGLVLAAIGAPLLGQGIATRHSTTCAAFPMTPGVCGDEARNLQIGGGVTLGVGLSFAISGGVLFGIGRPQ